MVMMVGYRGWTRHGVINDTAAFYTERFLHAFNINYYLVESDEDADRISIALKRPRGRSARLLCWSATNITDST